MKPILIKDMPAALRPRERVEQNGAAHLPEEVLLAIILRNGRPGTSVTDLARELIVAFGSLRALAGASWREIVAKKIPGIGKVKAIEIESAMELGRRLVTEIVTEKEIAADDSEKIFRLLRPQLTGLRQELVWVFLVSAKGTLIGLPRVVARGSFQSGDFDARSIFDPAIREGAAGVVVVHNHPNGLPEASKEDLEATRQLKAAAKILHIPLLDHLIVTESGYQSISPQ